MDIMVSIREKLAELYDVQEVQVAEQGIAALMEQAGDAKIEAELVINYPGADTACLICYANSISGKGKSPLKALREFIKKYDLQKSLPMVHLLPFFPWDTDRGFSVKDYYNVEPEYGSWEDVADLSRNVELMFDYVANHASIENALIQKALIVRHLKEKDPLYAEYSKYADFVTCFDKGESLDEETLKAVARPRSAPVLTPYTVVKTDNSYQAYAGEPGKFRIKGDYEIAGEGLVWTTFSRLPDKEGMEDTRQVDLNFKNPAVLVEALKILLFYVQKGATYLRLDAVGYIWKKYGSSCLHEKEVFTIIEIMKLFLTSVAPEAISIGEVNESQDRVFSYLGSDEAPACDSVYQFTHFPLAVHAVLNGTAKYYREWLKTIEVFKGRQFVTVLGSHDGMGMKPALGRLPKDQIESLLDFIIKEHKALPNYAKLPGGKEIVYEACGTPWCLINGPLTKGDEAGDTELQLARYMAVVALAFSVRGIPAFYINGVTAAGNHDPEGGLDENRTVNREAFDLEKLVSDLEDDTKVQGRVLESISKLLTLRAENSVFAPEAPVAEVLEVKNDAVVATSLENVEGTEKLFTFVNVSDKAQEVVLSGIIPEGLEIIDLISGAEISTETGALSMTPYQIYWLKPVVK